MRTTNPANLDDAINRYKSGQSIEQAATALHISPNTLARAIDARGIERHARRSHNRIEPVDGIIGRYVAGEHEVSLANEVGVSRTVIRRWLLEAGVTRRGLSEAGLIRAAQMTPEQRSARAAAAHDAVRGIPQPEERLVRSAQTRAASMTAQSQGERDLIAMLTDRGIVGIPQLAVGRYNIDLAIAPVAVELLGGKWHAYKTTSGERTKAILDAGWHLVFVWNHSRVPLDVGAADYIAAYAKQTRSDPSARCEYRVIRGDGQLVTSGSVDDYNLVRIEPARKTERRRGRHAS